MKCLLALVVASILTAPATAAFIVVDTFNNPNPGTFYLLATGSQMLAPQATGLGSTRTTTITVDNGVGANAVSGTVGFEPFFNAGVFDFNTNALSRASGTLHYNNFTGSAGNFFDGGIPAFLNLSFLNLDPGINISTNSPAATMPVDIAISTTSGSLNNSLLLGSSPGPISYQIPFDSFTGAGDLSQVISVTLTLNGGLNQRQASDFVLTGVIVENIAVPVPPTALLALTGLPLLARLRSRN